MREIKFRAWDKEKKEMLEWHQYKDWICDAIPWDAGDEWTERCEVMQYTALKDANGKEIYEGDIVEWFGFEVSNGKQIRPKRHKAVGEDWIDDCFALQNILETPGRVEVVGNIWENPELLEEEDVLLSNRD